MREPPRERRPTDAVAADCGFVDEPSRAVREADDLVADTRTWLGQRSDLEEQWARQDDVSTEQLRVILQRYRTFFDRQPGVQACA